uniref:Chlorophyll a-b binding protein, chloroplastic n=1 Tax=Picea sitchensis TaxID=3332 RepID=D5AAE1_PICSI|nr:unknown [Picea sitchensis]
MVMAAMTHGLFNPFKGGRIPAVSSTIKHNPTARIHPCKASWQELAGVLIFSAIPFTAVKAIANSPLAARLQERMQGTKSLAMKEAPEREAATQRARKESYEVLHARWAMLAALGVVIPELLDRFGVVDFIEPVWWRVGYAKLKARI